MSAQKQPSPFAGLFQRMLAKRNTATPPAGTATPPAGQDYSVLAKQIIAAAAKARGESPPDVARPQNLGANRILDAAALRDAGGPVRAAPTGLAAQIIAAGEKRRGLSKGN